MAQQGSGAHNPGQNRNPGQGTERPREEQAGESQQTHPTLVGCVIKSGKSDQEFFLTEQNSGTRYRLQASPDEWKDQVNHLVEVVGKPANAGGNATAVAGQNEPAFEVSGIQDLAPICGAAR